MALMSVIMFVAAMIGTILIIIFLVIAKRQHQQKSWQKTGGRITNHELLHKWYHIYMVNGVLSYVILKEYEYEVLGTVYLQREELQSMLKHYAILEMDILTPINSKVEVYYNPQNHHEATLEPGIKSSTYNYLFLGIVCLIAGGLMFNILYNSAGFHT